MSNTAASTSLGDGRRKTARAASAKILHDYRAVLDYREGFAQTFDPRPDGRRRAEIEDHHMMFGTVDYLLERQFTRSGAVGSAGIGRPTD
jgi:hypothetical protein